MCPSLQVHVHVGVTVGTGRRVQLGFHHLLFQQFTLGLEEFPVFLQHLLFGLQRRLPNKQTNQMRSGLKVKPKRRSTKATRYTSTTL